MTVKDKILQCYDCGTEFTFTAQEQEQFLSMGYTNSPRRCNACRQERKARQNVKLQSNVRNTGKYSGNDKKEMFSAVCIECKKETQVPFKPGPSKPVYCGMCYYKIKTNR
ncbi:MAG: zinc-ribbon domain containing protein [Dehalococcoidales bacterium]|nr:zinc-ribbon domain containing protein [Dehalococcoidales bacterium]